MYSTAHIFDDPIEPLFRQILNKGETEVRKWLEKNDVNTKTKKGFTLLHMSAQSGLKDILIILIIAKAKLEAMTERGTTPLQEAAIQGQIEIVKILKIAGANTAKAFDLAEKYNLPEIAKGIECAAWGSEETFRRQVQEEVDKWEKTYFTENLDEKTYMARLNDISAESSFADYLAKIRSALDKNYDPIENNMHFLREKIMKYIKIYYENAEIEDKLKKEILPNSAPYEISPSYSA